MITPGNNFNYFGNTPELPNFFYFSFPSEFELTVSDNFASSAVGRNRFVNCEKHDPYSSVTYNSLKSIPINFFPQPRVRRVDQHSYLRLKINVVSVRVPALPLMRRFSSGMD